MRLGCGVVGRLPEIGRKEFCRFRGLAGGEAFAGLGGQFCHLLGTAGAVEAGEHNRRARHGYQSNEQSKQPAFGGGSHAERILQKWGERDGEPIHKVADSGTPWLAREFLNQRFVRPLLGPVLALVFA